jgi:virginiamycin B lyase
VSVLNPPDPGGPFGVTAGPLGSEWFSLADGIARVDHQGTVHTYPVPTTDPNVGWLTASSSGAIWFSERGSGKVGRIEPNGAIREYQLPGQGQQGIVLPGNGDVYIAEQFSGDIARLDPATGHVTTYAVPNDGDPLGLAVGADGAIWFTERAAARVGRMTLDGHFSEFPLTPGAFPNRIVRAQDGAIWFTELFGEKVGRITVDGQMTEYPVSGGPVGITAGKDGQLYVVLFQSDQLARVSLDGQVTGTWDLPGGAGPLQVATGTGLDLWVTDPFADLVFRVTPYAVGD